MTKSTAVNQAPSKIVVIWQSLVVASYRVPFELLAQSKPQRIELISPDVFPELGGQEIRFQNTTSTQSYIHVLRVWRLHIQIVFFRNLTN